MKKILNLIKEFFVKLFSCKKTKQQEVLLGQTYSYDYDYVVECLESWKDLRVFKEWVKKYGITLDKKPESNDLNNHDQTEYNIKFLLYQLLYKLEYQDEEHRQKMIEKRIEEWKQMKVNKEKESIDYWRQEGILCPICGKAPMNTFYTGLVKVKFLGHYGGPIGGGVNISDEHTKEYQFHYKKCRDCGYWEMTEYRETPSWWDDLWNKDCPFTSGDLIEDFKKGKFYGKEYISHEVTRM